MNDKCPKCAAGPDEINAIVNAPHSPTAWACGSWVNSPDCPAPGFIQSADCARRCRISELEAENARLTAALHAARAHPDFIYMIVPVNYAETFDPKNSGWDQNVEWGTSMIGDQCFRRRKQP